MHPFPTNEAIQTCGGLLLMVLVLAGGLGMTVLLGTGTPYAFSLVVVAYAWTQLPPSTGRRVSRAEVLWYGAVAMTLLATAAVFWHLPGAMGVVFPSLA